MKNLLKTLFAILLTSMIMQSQAQQYFGIKGGLTLANTYQKATDKSTDLSYFSNYEVGGAWDFAVFDSTGSLPLYIQVQALINQRTVIKSTDYAFGVSKATYTITRLDIPVLATYRGNAGAFNYYGGLGVYAAYNLKGSAVYELTSNDSSAVQKITNDIEFSKDHRYWRYMDFGLMFAGAIEYKSLRLGLEYKMGLGKQTASSDGIVNQAYIDKDNWIDNYGVKPKNYSQLTLSLTYLFDVGKN